VEITQENKLEELLRLATNEPAHRPQFCDVLMDSTIFLLGRTEESGTDETINLKAGSQVQIQHWEKADGSPAIPFFSSLEVLQKSIDNEQSYLSLPLRSLFEITKGATLVLNPKSNYSKEFVPEEVVQLLSIGVSRAPLERVIEKKTNVLLSQPANYPTKMVDSLTQLFAKHPHVKKAYLAMMLDASAGEKPHLIVGVDIEGEMDKVVRDAINVAADTSEGEAVDFYRVKEGESGVSAYFINDTEPFYERKWGTKIRSWFGVGHA